MAIEGVRAGLIILTLGAVTTAVGVDSFLNYESPTPEELDGRNLLEALDDLAAAVVNWNSPQITLFGAFLALVGVFQIGVSVRR